jgi:hypothetical protein
VGARLIEMVEGIFEMRRHLSEIKTIIYDVHWQTLLKKTSWKLKEKDKKRVDKRD